MTENLERKTFLFVTLLPRVWKPGPILRDSRAGRRAPGSPRADTPHRSAPAPARRPGPHALTCSRSRILGAARPAQRPASRGPAARQPEPRPHSPAAVAVTGKAWRWDRPGAPHKETGRGPERQEDRRTDRRTDRHRTRGRSSGAAGAVMVPAHRGLLVNRKMHSPTHHTGVPQDTKKGQVVCEERKET
ncbi:translation initiation factor IF-2-like [Lontra canadensis]|uniref:translation initiation factor IF-2-like n=1 Tax=Lontra canadensis TaxID=76717 RepID=UPI0013F341C6|nr:translation initiation factor IF-2-like [Lontra canadensis]